MIRVYENGKERPKTFQPMTIKPYVIPGYNYSMNYIIGTAFQDTQKMGVIRGEANTYRYVSIRALKRFT